MAESEAAAGRLPPTGLMGFVRSHFAFVLTLIPILLTAMRVFAVANGDRATLVTLLSTINVTAVLLGTFAWLLPSAFAAASAVCWISWLQLRSLAEPAGTDQRRAFLWAALLTAIIALILFAFSPVNDLINLLFCLVAIFYFRKPARRGAAKAVIVGVAFSAIFLAPLVFRGANMWLPAERIAVKDQPVIVGYVLQLDPFYATVLQAADSSVQIIALSQIESRSICRLNPGLESGSLIRYISGSTSQRTPPC
jgi:hypothetical protein